MSIRAATPADIPALVAMGNRFHIAAGWDDITEYDSQSFAATLRALIPSDDAVVLSAEKDRQVVGMAGALIYPLYFNVGHRTAQEMFWFVDENHRGIGGELFDALLEEVKAKGAQSMSMIALDKMPGFVGEFYERRGFRPAERSYMRKL
jgi:GNAT superfamily N-acetyltransferase